MWWTRICQEQAPLNTTHMSSFHQNFAPEIISLLSVMQYIQSLFTPRTLSHVWCASLQRCFTHIQHTHSNRPSHLLPHFLACRGICYVHYKTYIRQRLRNLRLRAAQQAQRTVGKVCRALCRFFVDNRCGRTCQHATVARARVGRCEPPAVARPPSYRHRRRPDSAHKTIRAYDDSVPSS